MSREMGGRSGIVTQSRFRQHSPHDSREKLLQLAQKSHRVENRPSSYYSPELRPKMGLRAKDRCRGSMFVSEQSLPDKLSQALRNFRPGALVHSASSSAPFRLKNKGAVAADDVVYISAPEPRAKNATKEHEHNKRRHHSVLMNPMADGHVENRETTLKDLDQIRNLYKSVPNVSTLEDNDFRFRPSRYSRYMDDLEAEMSSSTRSPTDSGYRSTTRHATEENPYMLDDECDFGISHKTTTVVHVNGDSNSSTSFDEPVMRVHGANLSVFEDSLKSYGILNEFTSCPISERDIVAVLQGRRCKSVANLLDIAIVPKMAEAIYSSLVTLTEHIERLTSHAFKLVVDDVAAATKIVFPVDVYSACNKAGSQATAIFALSGSGGLKKGLSERSELRFPVGKISRWLIERMPEKPISDTISIYLTAVIECLLEEVVLKIVSTERESVLSLSEFEDAMLGDLNLSVFFARYDEISANVPSTITYLQMVETVGTLRQRMVIETEGSISSAKSSKRSRIKLSPKAAQALYYFITNSEAYKEAPVPLADWTRVSFTFAEHRMGSMVEPSDIQQAAKVLLNIDCPPVIVEFWMHSFSPDSNTEEATRNFAFSLITTGIPENVRHATHLLQDRLNGTNPFGLTALSESVVRGDEEVARMLISSGCPVNVGVPKSKAEKSPYLLTEYAGWTPLTWAVASQNVPMMEFLLGCSAELQNETMIKESPLQVAVQSGNRRIISRLLECGADPYYSSVIYDSTQACFRNCGCPSAISIAAARGDMLTVELFLDVLNRIDKTSVDDFLRQDQKKNESTSDFQKLPSPVRQSLQEAIYYAVENSRPEVAYAIKKRVSGLAWNLHTWTRALQGSAETKQKWLTDELISEFSPKLASELNEDNINYCLSVLFSLIKWECRKHGNPSGVAFAISRLWHYFSDNKSRHEEKRRSVPPKSAIDPSFINNEHLSDVRFRVDGEIIYGHRIVLFNASDKFRNILQSPKGVIDITDVSHKQFLAMIEFLYTGKLPTMEVAQLLALTSVADLYGFPQLKKEVEKTMQEMLSPSHIGEIYQFAIVHTNTQLLEKCECCVLESFDEVVGISKIRELLISSSDDYDVCAALSSRLITAFDLARSKKPVITV